MYIVLCSPLHGNLAQSYGSSSAILDHKHLPEGWKAELTWVVGYIPTETHITLFSVCMSVHIHNTRLK